MVFAGDFFKSEIRFAENAIKQKTPVQNFAYEFFNRKSDLPVKLAGDFQKIAGVTRRWIVLVGD